MNEIENKKENVIVEHEYYTYYTTPIRVAAVVNYTAFKSCLEYNRKKSNSNINATLKYFFTLYVNSLVFLNQEKTELHIFNILNKMMNDNQSDIDNYIKKIMIHNAFKNMQSIIDNKQLYYVMRNFIFDNNKLNIKFNNDKNLIYNYKKSVVFESNKKIGYKTRINNCLDAINELKDSMNKTELIKSLELKFDKNLIYKVIKDNNIILKSRSKSYLLLDKLFKEIFNNEEKITMKMTNDNLIIIMKNQVSLRTLTRYLSDNENVKNKIKIFNNNFVAPKIEVKKVINNNDTFNDIFELINLLEKEDEKKVETKIIKKEIEKWTEEDDEFIKKYNCRA